MNDRENEFLKEVLIIPAPAHFKSGETFADVIFGKNAYFNCPFCEAKIYTDSKKNRLNLLKNNGVVCPVCSSHYLPVIYDSEHKDGQALMRWHSWIYKSEENRISEAKKLIKQVEKDNYKTGKLYNFSGAEGVLEVANKILGKVGLDFFLRHTYENPRKEAGAFCKLLKSCCFCCWCEKDIDPKTKTDPCGNIFCCKKCAEEYHMAWHIDERFDIEEQMEEYRKEIKDLFSQ